MGWSWVYILVQTRGWIFLITKRPLGNTSNHRFERLLRVFLDVQHGGTEVFVVGHEFELVVDGGFRSLRHVALGPDVGELLVGAGDRVIRGVLGFEVLRGEVRPLGDAFCFLFHFSELSADVFLELRTSGDYKSFKATFHCSGLGVGLAVCLTELEDFLTRVAGEGFDLGVASEHGFCDFKRMQIYLYP